MRACGWHVAIFFAEGFVGGGTFRGGLWYDLVCGGGIRGKVLELPFLCVILVYDCRGSDSLLRTFSGSNSSVSQKL